MSPSELKTPVPNTEWASLLKWSPFTKLLKSVARTAWVEGQDVAATTKKAAYFNDIGVRGEIIHVPKNINDKSVAKQRVSSLETITYVQIN